VKREEFEGLMEVKRGFENSGSPETEFHRRKTEVRWPVAEIEGEKRFVGVKFGGRQRGQCTK